MTRLAFAIVAACCASALALAQEQPVEREVKAQSGHDARVGVYTNIRPDCTSGPLPTIRLTAPPAHGAVSVKRAALRATNVKQCLATEVPVYIVLYRAAGDFNGTDQFELEVSLASGRKQIQRIRMNVSRNPAGGEGI